MANKVSDEVNEATIGEYLSNDRVFFIPSYQRNYAWSPQLIKELVDDIQNISFGDGDEDIHFLGAIILVEKKALGPVTPQEIYIVDGQQRLTTIYLVLLAFVEILIECNQSHEAKNYFEKYISRKDRRCKIFLGRKDQKNFQEIIKNILETNDFKEILNQEYVPIFSDVIDGSKNITTKYKVIKKKLKDFVDNNDPIRLNNFISKLLLRTTWMPVRILNPQDATKIFKGLNGKRQPVGAGDLIKNEVFASVNLQSERDFNHAESKWNDYIDQFNQRNLDIEGYYFPFILFKKPNAVKANTFQLIISEWSSLSAERRIEDLSSLAKYYISIKKSLTYERLNPKVSSSINHLNSAVQLDALLPFFIHVLKAATEKSIDENEADKIVKILESFVVRRALCGHEPSGLHSVFKKLWQDLGDEKSCAKVEEIIRLKPTVKWPANPEISEVIHRKDFSKANITYFILREYETSLRGDSSNSSDLTIEHILPQQINGIDYWTEKYNERQHKTYLNLIGNLLPSTARLNTRLSNKPFDEKKRIYAEDSSFKSMRKIGREHNEWTPSSIENRTKEITEWILRRWDK
jgi:uncharacterized protein with ParB-like and HNH nuclease domain